jgi:hypothetical protein
MSQKYMRIHTGIQEIYMKLPALNYSNEVVFSEFVPDSSIRKILEKFNKNRIVLESFKVGNKTVIVKKSDLKFNTYLL